MTSPSSFAPGAGPGASRLPRLLTLFMVINLVIGSSAFMVTGLLQDIARALNTSVAAAGQAMTAYALATALLAPLLLMATGRLKRRHALALALGLLTLGNAMSALSDQLATFLLARVLMGVGAAATPLMAGVAVSITPPQARGRALAWVFLGMSLSYVVGVPLGSWLGFGWGWHTPMALAAVCSGGLALLVWRLLPDHAESAGASFSGLGALLRQRAVLAALTVTLLYFMGIFSIFSYIGPVVQALSGFSGGAMATVIGVFGVAGALGTWLGGRAADRFGARRTMLTALGLLTGCFALLPLTLGHPVPMMALLLIWGASGFGMMAPQQGRLATLAGPRTALALSLNASMLYLGTALGAAVGGVAVATVGFLHLPWVAVPLALAAWGLMRWGPR